MKLGKGIFRTTLLSMILSCVAGVSVFAQTSVAVPPDAFVRGSGAIAIANSAVSNTAPDLGLFTIDVSAFGATVRGGFTFAQVEPGGKRDAVIVSRIVKSLSVVNGSATVVAAGLLNNQPSMITLVAVDSPTGDSLHIHAQPADTTLKAYDAQGKVVRGEIIVFQQAADLGFARGSGTINLASPQANLLPHVGVFQFSAQQTPSGPMGMISFAETIPVLATPIQPPGVRIYVPKVTRLDINGHTAMLSGAGTMNGKPVEVIVVASDNDGNPLPLPVIGPGPLPPVKPDTFAITAIMLNTGVVVYHAQGALASGDIVVGMFLPPVY